MNPIQTPMPEEIQPLEGIAIIGMAGKFPGAPTVEAFWQNLLAGRDSITRFDPADLEARTAAASSDYVSARGILDDAAMFDAEFFGIAPREADRMDPQHRLFLEACSDALEDAGYTSHDSPAEIGLFAGCSLNTYLLANLCHDRAFIDELTSNYQVGEFQVALGNDKDFLTTRAAYKLNLRGPVVSVQSACATSLVAVCQAAQALLNYQCDMALAGGVSATFPQHRGHVYQEGGMASSDGFCRPFDAHATGTVFGHGVGVVLLKRLEDALRDGDHIAAVIRGFAVNNDGSQKAGYMAPGVDGQSRAIAAAHSMSVIDPASISYVEAHGTGTPLGDPIEVAALTKAFRLRTDRTAFCSLGTAKANIGHLDSAAGITGLIKTTLSLQHRTIPALAHFAAPNPAIDFPASPFFIATENTPWHSKTPLRAGVSAFGVGGVNAHVVLEEAPPQLARPTTRPDHLLCLSARTPTALAAAAERLAAHFDQHPEASLADAAYTLAVGRRTFPHRLAVPAPDLASAARNLRAATLRPPTRKFPPRLAFLFSGQGSQFPGMGADLYHSEPIYRATVDECCDLATPLLGLDLRTLLLAAPGSPADQLAQTRYAQPALFLTELALARLWQSWGVTPEATVGHSLGEYVAATLADVFTPHAALRLVCARGLAMQTLPPGAMCSVALGEAALTPFLTPELSIAALNSPRASVLSGPVPAIEALEARLLAAGIAHRRLHTSHAFHSAMMAPMLDAFAAEVARANPQPPAQPFVSSVTGTWITPAQATDPRYWADQCRKPVRFADSIRTLLNAGLDFFLEVGPGEALTSLASHQRPDPSAGAPFAALPSLPMPRGDAPAKSILHPLAQLWTEGVRIDWPAFYAAEPRGRIPLPTYPFERKLHWVEPPPRQQPTLSTAPPVTLETPPMPPVPSPISTPRPIRLQREIARVFAELSGIETRPEEMDHQFLELGFDSLFLTQATQSLSRAFSVKLTFRQLMEQHSTISSLALYLDSILPPEAFAETPTAPPTQSPTPTASVDQLLASQLAALSGMFAQQVAALTAAATGLPPQTPAPTPTQKPTPPISNADVKHGSFRPIQNKAQHDLDDSQKHYIADLIARYTALTPTSKRLTAASRPHLADPRAVAGFRPQWKEMVYPLITERALGSKLWDVDGNEFIDIVNGYGCILFGHSPDFVLEAIRAQLDRGVAIGPQAALAGEVAALLCELTGNERATFCNTGSEAVMAAIRVARTVTGRDTIVYFAGDYHGTFDEVLVRNTPRGSAPVAPGIPLNNTRNIVVLDYGTDESLTWIRTHADTLAAVLIEPVQTRNPGLQPIDFIRAVRQITADHGAALILDEVVTGFRLAPGGAQQHFGIRADMCTYGKVIGGGHPIGVLSGKAQYLDALDGGAWQYGDDSGPEVGVTFFAGTFVRHPLALAAARSVLLHLKHAGPALQSDLNLKTAKLADSLDRFFAERGVPSRVHHFTSWFYFTFPHDARLAPLLYYSMRSKGIHIQEGYPCFLTTAHTEADLAAIERAFRDTILEMQAAGALPPPPSAPEPPTPTTHPFALAQPPARVPLTEPQREVFLAAALSDDANCAFNESLTLHLHGPVRQPDLAFALDAVVARHDALRATITEDGEALSFAPAFSGQTEFIDLRNTDPEAAAAAIAERTTREGRTPFDLYNGPLLRFVCFRTSDTSATILLTAHHIVLDGWSANQLLEEIGQVYSRGPQALTTLSPLLPFSSYALRESERNAAGDFKENELFWVSKFEGRSPRLDLPLDRPRPATKTFRGATAEGTLGLPLYTALKQLSAKNGCTLYVTLLSSFQLLLHRLTRQDEVVVGISTAGQALLEGASLVGHCVNFLPMLSELTPGQTAAEHLRTTRTALLDAYDHQEFTFGSLLSRLKLERDPSRLPLIEAQFNLERVGANVHFDGLTSTIRTNPKQFVNTDLFLNVIESPTGLSFTCDFNADLLDHTTIDRWMALWTQLLTSEIADPSTPILQLEILPPTERDLVHRTWNQTATDFGPFESMPAAFLRVAALHPQRVAIDCGARSWTYAEAAEYASILARRLLREGLRPGTLVGICIERSLEMAGAMLAVMLAGGAYVPLDPRHPRERLAAIIADSGIRFLLAGRDPSVETSARILNITGPQPTGSEPLPPPPSAEALAYVIYTSGSTGIPKGVAVQHGALMNLLRSMQQTPGLHADDVLVAVTTLAFDIAALELLLPLLTGARLVIATDDQVHDGPLLLQLLKTSGATVLQATPGAWRILLDAGWSSASQPAALPLKVLCGGEALPRDLADMLLERCPARGADGSQVWNVYGPTETTVWSSATRVLPGTGPLRIGPPIANTAFLLLDDLRNPVPIGVTGDLYIGGAGLAHGYWRNPALTAEKFLPNPFGPGRIYHTGDLGRWHRDGTIQLLGRSDFQVKIRGYRIELGDIESALRQHPHVAEAVVLQQHPPSGGPAHLVAFVDGAAPTAPDTEAFIQELRALLDRTLPEYMIPAAIFALPAIPRTPNGKVDRKALPTLTEGLELALKSKRKPFTAPVTEDEKRLAAIWEEVLSVSPISTSDSIFELGADSLLIFRIAARAQREGLPFNATSIFQHRTIAALCQSLTQTSDAQTPNHPAARIGAISRDAYRRPRVKSDA